MGLLIESIVVGIYAMVLFFFISFFSTNYFVFGFLKHLVGYYVRLHDIYCHTYEMGNALSNMILTDSVMEGSYYMILGYIVGKRMTIWMIGLLSVITHILMEYVGIHTWFLHNRCKK